MVEGPSASLIDAIRNPASPQQQVLALKQLKNSIIGNDQRKEIAVKIGALEPLVHILRAASRFTDEQGHHHVNGAALTHSTARCEEDNVRVQATLVVGCLAAGGPAFIAPLLSAGVAEVLLDALKLETAPRLLTATLQALKSVAASWTDALEANGGTVGHLDLFTDASNKAFTAILTASSTLASHKRQQVLVADIISTAASTDKTKASLVISRAGPVLETLASLLASYAIANRHVDYHGETSRYPPAPSPTSIPSIMSAISIIIAGSTYRVHRFFLAPAIQDLFLNSWPANSDQRHRFGPRHGFESQAGETLLPPLHIPTSATTSYYGGSRAFPALASLQRGKWRGESGFDEMPYVGDADHANAVCGWLLYLARTMHGSDRLTALRLLALVNNAIDVDMAGASHRSEFMQKSKEREMQLGLLAVPLAVKLVQSANESEVPEGAVRDDENIKDIKGRACGVLALLIRDSRALQVAAVAAGALKHVCSILKKSFDDVPLAKPMWSARSAAQQTNDLPESWRMGSRGLPPEILHVMRVRQNALDAIAALTEKEDLNRKMVVEAGVVSCIIESLKPFAPDYHNNLSLKRGQISPKDGNTTAVILAACRAAKSMSRSVSLLRTSLIDAGIAKPIVQLLSHRDAQIQLEATNVCANLVLDFSPMRDDLVAAGVVKVLTEHARQSSPALRSSSLWALKHLMMSSPKEIKISALEELGTGWLMAAIQGEQRETAPPSGGGVSVGLSTPNAAGEQVNLLNPSSMDVDEPNYDDEDDDDNEDDDDDDDDNDDNDEDVDYADDDGEVMFDESSGTPYQASRLRSTLDPPVPSFNRARYLSTVREMEQNPTLQAKRDDVAVQEQALDFIRNMLNGEDCAVMLEHLLQQIGTSKLFELLTAKLAPLPLSRQSSRSANGSSNSNSNSKHIYNPTELILSTVHILNHIANALPRHKQLLIAQRPLLHAWLPHFAHADRRVRVMCVWAVNSLTWIEDAGDRQEARQRALELRAVGIEAAVRGAANDADIDVRERVRTAVTQMDMLL